MIIKFKNLIFSLSTATFFLSSSLPIQSGENFVGEFDVSNWSTEGSNGDGFVDTTNAPDSITITGPNDGTRRSAQKFFIQIPSELSGIYIYSFDWSYETEDRDGPSFDYPRLIRGTGTPTTFSSFSTSGANNQSGSFSTYANVGDNFGFEIYSTDGILGDASVTISSFMFTDRSEWLQPYAAMQNVGLKSIHNNRDLVLAKAGECNNYGWMIGESDYCVYTNVQNQSSYVNGDTTKGSYESIVFNGSLNLEKTINDKWKAGFAYGMGTADLYNFDFSGMVADLYSSNNHFSVYGVKKVNNSFTLKGMVGGSVFDSKSKRTFLTTSATSSYEANGYTAEINGTWDIKKEIKNSKTPIRLKPTVGVAFAAHAQDGFSESGSGNLMTVNSNQSESLLFKTGIGVDKQITMQQGWLLVPSIALNYEMDNYAGDSTRDLEGKLTESSAASTSVEAKTFGKHRGSLRLGADFLLNKDFMFNLNAEYGLATDGDENSYGGGFRWQF